MYQKLCPKCHQLSFGSCDTGSWICPTCQYDLSSKHHSDKESHQSKSPQYLLIQSRYDKHHEKSASQVSPYLFKAFD